jgi:hypothetical protein
MQVRRRPSESSCRLPGNLLPHGTCGRLWGQPSQRLSGRPAESSRTDRADGQPAAAAAASRPCHLSAVTRDKGSPPARPPASLWQPSAAVCVLQRCRHTPAQYRALIPSRRGGPCSGRRSRTEPSCLSTACAVHVVFGPVPTRLVGALSACHMLCLAISQQSGPLADRPALLCLGGVDNRCSVAVAVVVPRAPLHARPGNTLGRQGECQRPADPRHVSSRYSTREGKRMVVAYHLLEACQGTGDREQKTGNNEQKTGNKKHVHGSCHVACLSLSVSGWLSFVVLCSSSSSLRLYHDSDSDMT